MNKISALLIILSIFAFCAVIIAQATITKDIINIETPKKKDGGEPTTVLYKHKEHAETHAGNCETCHPPLKQEVNAEANSMLVVHETCRKCHSKSKMPEAWSCSYCHKP